MAKKQKGVTEGGQTFDSMEAGIKSELSDREPLRFDRERPDVVGGNDAQGKAIVVKPFDPLKAEESKKIDRVMTRFEDMKRKRAKTTNRWPLHQKQFEAMWVPYSDGRARVNVPLEYAMTEQFVAEAIARKTVMDIKPASPGDEPRAFGLRMVRDYDWVKHNRDKEELKNEYKTAILGTSGIAVDYDLSRRVIHDPVHKDDGSVSFKKVMLQEGKVIYEDMDMRFFYPDDRATDFDEAVDCIRRRFLTPEAVENLKNVGNYRNLDGLQALTRRDVSYRTKEDSFQIDKVIEFKDYWNWQTDTLITVANDERIVREMPIPFAHKKLPFAMRQYSHNPLSIWGRGIPEVLLSFKHEINQFKEMLIDGLRRSNNSAFALGGDLAFDSEEFGFNNAFIRFNGKMEGNFHELRGQSPNQAAFNYLDQIYRDVAMFLGLDPQSLLATPSGTAFEASIKQESSLKRVNVVLRNRDAAFSRAYRLYLSNLQQFYPLKLASRIVYGESKEGEEAQPDFEGSGDVEAPTVPLKDKAFNGTNFYDKPGLASFQVTPDAIRGEFGIEVKTNLNTPSLKQLEKENMADFYVKAANMAAAAANVPALQKNMEKVIGELAFLSGVDLGNDAGGQEAKAKAEEMRKALEGMAQGMSAGLPPEGEPAPAAAAPETPELPLSPEDQMATASFGPDSAPPTEGTTVGL
jgi:hypothetical protein